MLFRSYNNAVLPTLIEDKEPIEWLTAVAGEPILEIASDTTLYMVYLQVDPTMPANLTAVAGDTSIELTWEASTGKFEIAGYAVSINGESVADSLKTTSYTFINLSAETEYTIEVEAFDVKGHKSEIAAITVTTLKPTSIEGVQALVAKVFFVQDRLIMEAQGNLLEIGRASCRERVYGLV